MPVLPDVGSMIDRVGAQDAATLRVLDHRERDAVLDAAAWVAALLLHPHGELRGIEAVHAHVGGSTDRGEDVVEGHAGSSFR